MKSKGFATLGSDLAVVQTVPPEAWADARLATAKGRAEIAAAGLAVIERHKMREVNVRLSWRDTRDLHRKVHGELTREEEHALFAYVNMLRADAQSVIERKVGPRPFSKYAGRMTNQKQRDREAWIAACAADGDVRTARARASAVIDLVVRWNVGLVAAAAGTCKVGMKHPKREDFWADALVSLHKAADGFDLGRGLKFSTFAVRIMVKNWWRRQSREKVKAGAHASLSARSEDGHLVLADGCADAAYKRSAVSLWQRAMEDVGQVAAAVIQREDLAQELGVDEIIVSTLRRRLAGMKLHEIAAEDARTKACVSQRLVIARRELLRYCMETLGRGGELPGEMRRAGLVEGEPAVTAAQREARLRRSYRLGVAKRNKENTLRRAYKEA